MGIARERSTYRSAYGHEPQVWARLTAMADHAADLPDLVQRLLRGAEHLYELTTNSAWNTCLRATLQARHPGLSVRAVDRRIRTLAEHERHRRAEQSQVI
ncbi:hypothetical protein [Nocardiopsis synnemataformans]|uniref:hypothetical protein n=1 Tax=Nocardiopsis synnemataformans TaxID=61305 RepID=UPI003EBAD5D7